MTIESLIERLGSRDADLRGEAFASLRSYGGDAVPHLISALDDNDKKLYAAELLGELEAREAFDRLTELLEDEDYIVRAEALSSLYFIDSQEAFPIVINRLENDKDLWVRYRAGNLLELTMMNKDDARPALINAVINDDSDSVREICAGVLGLCTKTDEIVDCLKGALKDENLEVRIAAAGALGKHGYEDGHGIALEVLCDEEREYDKETRDKAAAALGYIGINDPETIGALEGYLEDECSAYQALERLKNL